MSTLPSWLASPGIVSTRDGILLNELSLGGMIQ